MRSLSAAASEVEADRLWAEQVNLIAQVESLDAARLRDRQDPPRPHAGRGNDPAIGNDGAGNVRVEVRFDMPQRGVAPGQSVVFYQGDLVVGGGVIARPEPRMALTVFESGVILE